MKTNSQIFTIKTSRCNTVKLCGKCTQNCVVHNAIQTKNTYPEIDGHSCISCATCFNACTQKAISYIDDLEDFIHVLTTDALFICVCSPSFADSLGSSLESTLSFLYNAGVSYIYDAGALALDCARAFALEVEERKGLSILGTCPPVYDYIKKYRKDLLKNILDTDAPLIAMAKKARELHKNCNKKIIIAAITPCPSKKLEFVEKNSNEIIMDFNITFHNLIEYVEKNKLLNTNEKRSFSIEGSLEGKELSKPGALINAIGSFIPNTNTRVLKGIHEVIAYINTIPPYAKERETILVECLNCTGGCKTGPGNLE